MDLSLFLFRGRQTLIDLASVCVGTVLEPEQTGPGGLAKAPAPQGRPAQPPGLGASALGTHAGRVGFPTPPRMESAC